MSNKYTLIRTFYIDGNPIKTEKVETGYLLPRYYEFQTLQEGIEVLSGPVFEGTLNHTKTSKTYRDNNLTIVKSIERY